MHRAGAAWNRNLSSAAASSTHRVMLRLSVETPDASKKEHNFKNKVTAGLAWSLLSPLPPVTDSSDSHLPYVGYIQNCLYFRLLKIFVRWIQYC